MKFKVEIKNDNLYINNKNFSVNYLTLLTFLKTNRENIVSRLNNLKSDVLILTAKLQLIDDIIDILDCKDDIDKI